LLLGSLALATLAIVTFFVPAALSLRTAEREAQELELLREAAEAAARVPAPSTRLPDEARLAGEHRYGLYGEDGARLDGDGPLEPDAVVLGAMAGRATTGRVADFAVAAVPLTGRHVLRVAEPASEADARYTAAVRRLAAIGLVTVAGAGVAAAGLAQFLTRPLRSLRDRARRLGAGDFASPAFTASGVAEIDDVARAIGAATARIGELVDRERQLTADASHQLRTPIAGMRLAVETELTEPRDDRTEILGEVLEGLDRLESTVAALVALAREAPPADARTAVGDAVRAARDRWRGPFQREGREVALTVAGDRLVRPRERAIETALDVVLENALVHGRGVATISVSDVGAAVVVGIRDEGRCDVADETLFGRRSAGSSGSGIGLHLARTVLESDGGRLRRTSTEPTTFELLLPASEPPSVPRRP
jgi:signal transduction histidine kinase